jgi:hypothetical protein
MWVDRSGSGYADILRDGRRFRFSHEAVLRGDGDFREKWLVFTDVGRAAS